MAGTHGGVGCAEAILFQDGKPLGRLPWHVYQKGGKSSRYLSASRLPAFGTPGWIHLTRRVHADVRTTKNVRLRQPCMTYPTLLANWVFG